MCLSFDNNKNGYLTIINIDRSRKNKIKLNKKATKYLHRGGNHLSYGIASHKINI